MHIEINTASLNIRRLRLHSTRGAYNKCHWRERDLLCFISFLSSECIRQHYLAETLVLPLERRNAVRRTKTMSNICYSRRFTDALVLCMLQILYAQQSFDLEFWRLACDISPLSLFSFARKCRRECMLYSFMPVFLCQNYRFLKQWRILVSNPETF